MIHVALVLAQYRAAVTVGDRTELRTRFVETTTATGATYRPVFDLNTAPTVALTLNNRRVAHSLSYSPRLTLRGDALPGQNPELLQSGSFNTGWRARRATLALSESASYGARNFGDLAPQTSTTTTAAPPQGTQIIDTGRPLVPLQALPTTRSINYGATHTTLSSSVVPDRGWSVGTSASYFMSGGTDSVAQVFLPLQRGGNVNASVAYALSRSDRIVTSVTPAVTFVPKAICAFQPLPTVPPSAPITCNRTLQVLDVSEGWAKQWTRQTSTNFVGGVSVRRTRLDVATPFRTRIGPIVGVDLSHRLGRTLVVANGRVGTVMDQRTGLPDTRMSETLTADWKHFIHQLHGSLTYTQTLGATPVNTIHVLYGEAVATRRLSSRFDADAGVRVTWQENQGTATLLTNVVLGIVYHEPRILF